MFGPPLVQAEQLANEEGALKEIQDALARTERVWQGLTLRLEAARMAEVTVEEGEGGEGGGVRLDTATTSSPDFGKLAELASELDQVCDE